MYALISSSEDGNPITLFEDVNEVLESPEDYSIEEFVDAEFLKANPDTNYWDRGKVALIKFEVLEPKPITSKYTI